MNIEGRLTEDQIKRLFTMVREPEFVVCPDCDGDFEQVSSCCGAYMDSDIMICSDCKDHSDFAVCDTCNGDGKISKNSNVLRDNKDSDN